RTSWRSCCRSRSIAACRRRSTASAPRARRSRSAGSRAVAGTLFPPGPVGFIGLGNMGRPMARRLLGAGYRLQLHDASPAALAASQSGEGAKAAASPAALAHEVEAVITMLPDGKSVAAVVNAIVDSLKPGAVIIDMSSSDPVGTRRLGKTLAE